MSAHDAALMVILVAASMLATLRIAHVHMVRHVGSVKPKPVRRVGKRYDNLDKAAEMQEHVSHPPQRPVTLVDTLLNPDGHTPVDEKARAAAQRWLDGDFDLEDAEDHNPFL
jgi:hypothetical protein